MKSVQNRLLTIKWTLEDFKAVQYGRNKSPYVFTRSILQIERQIAVVDELIAEELERVKADETKT